jgi:hypothetical protein
MLNRSPVTHECLLARQAGVATRASTSWLPSLPSWVTTKRGQTREQARPGPSAHRVWLSPVPRRSQHGNLSLPKGRLTPIPGVAQGRHIAPQADSGPGRHHCCPPISSAAPTGRTTPEDGAPSGATKKHGAVGMRDPDPLGSSPTADVRSIPWSPIPIRACRSRNPLPN